MTNIVFYNFQDDSSWKDRKLSGKDRYRNRHELICDLQSDEYAFIYMPQKYE